MIVGYSCYQGYIEELLYGQEYRWNKWIEDINAAHPYVPKPKRIDDGVQVISIVFFYC